MARDATHRAAAPADDATEQALTRMLLIRAVEERLLSLFAEGKLFGTTHTCIGQETCAVAVIGALDRARDVIFSSHRCHGHYLMYTDAPEPLFAEIMGRRTGICGGRGGSQHLCVDNFHSNGVQGGIVPIATGVALAEQRAGSGAVTVCFLGDGTLGEGVIYEAFNMAALWRAPILFVLEHNRYAQSTPTERTTAGDVAARAAAFGIATDRRPADDPVALTAHMREVVARVRRGDGPFFQVLDTYRLAAHSKGDDDRDAAELAAHRADDPLLRLRARVGEATAGALAQAVAARVDAAVAAAEAAPYADVDPQAEARSFAARGECRDLPPAFAHSVRDPAQLVVQHLNAALHRLMRERDDVVLLGEDLDDPYGGAFKVSRGLSTAFPDRVRSTPISEAGFIGLATGLALRGQRPVVEIMFGDFLALAADQILNHLTKFRWMYNDQVEVPLVIRTPVGGRRGYGPTHSQCIEKMFLGVPGLVVVAISLRHDPGELLHRAVQLDPRPVLFLEQKLLYAKRLHVEPPPGLLFELHPSEAEALYPTGIWRPAEASGDVTVVTYGGMTEIAEAAVAAAFAEDEVVAELVVPAQLAPLRIDPILHSVRRTGRLVVVEEGTGPWGFGAEVVAAVSEALSGQSLRCARVAAHPLPIPGARPAEDAVLPDAARVVAAIRQVMR
ncbi:MAG TPA: thiamine pyrophosphate-dependent enzyme [Candidatus Dormibacteraeota bacterium]|nr:thiamine pyrophosphate-dependent enzyme [Candidatus Dormibacteraeota bacterium]